MKRGAIIAIDTLIQLGIILVIFLIVFLGLFPGFERKLEAAEEKGKCEWAVLLAAVRKSGSLGVAEGVPEGCKAARPTVTMADLRGKRTYARNRLKIITDPAHKEYESVSPYWRTKDPQDEKILNEFALATLVAEQLESCWTKVFKGKTPLFDEWWRLYDVCDDPKTATKEECSTLETIATSAWQVITGDPNQAPVNCIVCAHVSFDKEVREYFVKIGKAKIEDNVMREWLGINPLPRTSTSYLKFLEEGQTLGNIGKLGLGYGFTMDEQGIAIIFKKINSHQLFQTAATLTSWTGTVPPEDESYLELVPYTQSEIVGPGPGKCTFILD